MENTGAIYGVSSLKYNGAKLGLISEDGMQPGGDPPHQEPYLGSTET